MSGVRAVIVANIVAARVLWWVAQGLWKLGVLASRGFAWIVTTVDGRSP